VVVDGKLTEWAPLADPGGLPRVIVTVEPTRWWLAFETAAQITSPLAFQLSLPGGDLPSYYVYSSGGVDEFDCERYGTPVESKRRTAECRRRLVAAKRHAELSSAYASRFATRIEFDGERLHFSRNSTKKPAASTQQACIRDEQRTSCEFELPLSLLPRTAAVELTEVGFLPDFKTNVPQEATWVALPEPIAFESGLWVHQNAMPSYAAGDAFSYQPGAGAEYDIAFRDNGGDGTSNVSITNCGPGPVLATLGRVTLLGNCARAHMNFIYLDGVPIGTAVDGKVLVRDNTLVVLQRREYFSYQYYCPTAYWTVELIDSDGAKRTPLDVNTEGLNCKTSTARANADYTKLSLSCANLTVDNEKQVITRVWHWDRNERTYVEQE
jgi:hypothetical protein